MFSSLICGGVCSYFVPLFQARLRPSSAYSTASRSFNAHPCSPLLKSIALAIPFPMHLPVSPNHPDLDPHSFRIAYYIRVRAWVRSEGGEGNVGGAVGMDQTHMISAWTPTCCSTHEASTIPRSRTWKVTGTSGWRRETLGRTHKPNPTTGSRAYTGQPQQR